MHIVKWTRHYAIIDNDHVEAFLRGACDPQVTDVEITKMCLAMIDALNAHTIDEMIADGMILWSRDDEAADSFAALERSIFVVKAFQDALKLMVEAGIKATVNRFFSIINWRGPGYYGELLFDVGYDKTSIFAYYYVGEEDMDPNELTVTAFNMGVGTPFFVEDPRGYDEVK